MENIHFLDLETQEQLASFIRQGSFHIFKSDQKISSDVRIICSSNLNLSDLVQQNKFSKSLYQELKNTLIMPSLLTLSEDELRNLAQGYSEQAIQADTFKNLLELTDKEKMNIINKRPVSLQEFKNKVQQILTEKTKKNNVQQETHFDPAYNISDPKLIEAARLGKHALKDPTILVLLWNKFKNQNKIATFLGVNRSSVHRRFKEYKIE
jgi:two-component system, NtrC family, response regulator